MSPRNASAVGGGRRGCWGTGRTLAAVNHLQRLVRLPRPADRRERFIEVLPVFVGEPYIRRRDILPEVRAALRPRNRDDVLAPVEQPGECDLARSDASL